MEKHMKECLYYLLSLTKRRRNTKEDICAVPCFLVVYI